VSLVLRLCHYYTEVLRPNWLDLSAFVFDLEVCSSRYTFRFFVSWSMAGPCRNSGAHSAVFQPLNHTIRFMFIPSNTTIY